MSKEMFQPNKLASPPATTQVPDTRKQALADICAKTNATI